MLPKGLLGAFDDIGGYPEAAASAFFGAGVAEVFPNGFFGAAADMGG